MRPPVPPLKVRHPSNSFPFVLDPVHCPGAMVAAPGLRPERLVMPCSKPSDTPPTPSKTTGCPLPPTATSSRTRGCRSEEHTSELQSLMRISYAVFCLKKKKTHTR